MAKLHIKEIIDHLERDIKKALEATMREHFPDQEFNGKAVYKTFNQQVEKKCNTWEIIPNKYIKSS